LALGAAVGHIHQMIAERNFAPGNAGTFFYMDIIIPLFGFPLLLLQYRLRGPMTKSVVSCPLDSVGP